MSRTLINSILKHTWFHNWPRDSSEVHRENVFKMFPSGHVWFLQIYVVEQEIRNWKQPYITEYKHEHLHHPAGRSLFPVFLFFHSAFIPFTRRLPAHHPSMGGVQSHKRKTAREQSWACTPSDVLGEILVPVAWGRHVRGQGEEERRWGRKMSEGHWWGILQILKHGWWLRVMEQVKQRRADDVTWLHSPCLAGLCACFYVTPAHKCGWINVGMIRNK